MNVLILGGTTEASAIAAGLAGDPAIHAVLSLAGRTRAPVLPAIGVRSGGFGGVDGLVRYLRAHAIDVLVDATHPFAAQISRHALQAATQAGIARLAVIRPAWAPRPGDAWTMVADMAGAVAALGTAPKKVFLTVGQQELAPFRAAPWHDYLIRSVEPPDPAFLPPRARCIAARGPFALADEHALLAGEAIEMVVTKNSGGSATAAKLEAARLLGLPVVMVARPPGVEGPMVEDAAEALAWLRHQASTRRGV
jgi:precorrin-6A/cobalt-precorrin-6A reductase